MALKNYKLDGALYLASRMVMNNANPPGDAIDLTEGGGFELAADGEVDATKACNAADSRLGGGGGGFELAADGEVDAAKACNAADSRLSGGGGGSIEILRVGEENPDQYGQGVLAKKTYWNSALTRFITISDGLAFDYVQSLRIDAETIKTVTGITSDNPAMVFSAPPEFYTDAGGFRGIQFVIDVGVPNGTETVLRWSWNGVPFVWNLIAGEM